MIVVLLAGLSAFALLAAWVLRVDSTSLWPLGEAGRYALWRPAPTWPRAAQADTDIEWRDPSTVLSVGGPRSAGIVRPVALAGVVSPTRPQRRVGSR